MRPVTARSLLHVRSADCPASDEIRLAELMVSAERRFELPDQCVCRQQDATADIVLRAHPACPDTCADHRDGLFRTPTSRTSRDGTSHAPRREAWCGSRDTRPRDWRLVPHRSVVADMM